MGFFSGKNSSASAPNPQQIEFDAIKSELETTINNLQTQLTRHKDELNSTKEQNRILQSSLNDRERQVSFAVKKCFETLAKKYVLRNCGYYS